MLTKEHEEIITAEENFITRVSQAKCKKEQQETFMREFLMMKEALRKISFNPMLKSEIISLARETYKALSED